TGSPPSRRRRRAGPSSPRATPTPAPTAGRWRPPATAGRPSTRSGGPGSSSAGCTSPGAAGDGSARSPSSWPSGPSSPFGSARSRANHDQDPLRRHGLEVAADPRGARCGRRAGRHGHLRHLHRHHQCQPVGGGGDRGHRPRQHRRLHQPAHGQRLRARARRHDPALVRPVEHRQPGPGLHRPHHQRVPLVAARHRRHQRAPDGHRPLLGGLDRIRVVARLHLQLQRLDDDDRHQPGGDPVVAEHGRPERADRGRDRPPPAHADVPRHRRQHVPGAELDAHLQLPGHAAGGHRPLTRRTAVMSVLSRWTGRILLAAALTVLAVVGLGPLTGRYRLATVLSGSMAPQMPVGSVAVLVPEDPAAVRVGDVITFQAPTPDHRTVTHRVVEIIEGGHHPVLRTKGDANPVADPWTARLAGSRAWRRVAVVPGAGTAIRLLRSSTVHRLTVQVGPAVLLASMLLAIWWPGRLSRRRRAAVLAAVGLVASAPAALAAFTATTTATNHIAAANDWLPPSVRATVVAKQTGYRAGAIKQGGTYYVYANVADSGNPPSGVSTVKADVSAITTGATAVSLTAGSYSINGVSYGYRSAALTANGTLSGTKNYTITSTDVLTHAQTQSGYSVAVDNTPPTATDIQTTNHAG